MEKFLTVEAIAAPLMRVNVDTDIIIPSREMKRVSKKGLSDGLFAGWRYSDVKTRTPNADFILNAPKYLGTQILITGDNFGCGSSREHAVWALSEYGIRAIIAPSFSAIFYNNCIQNGVLPVRLPAKDVERVAVEAVGGGGGMFSIDLPTQTVTSPLKQKYSFEISPTQKQILLGGLDPIERTLTYTADINAFEQQHMKKAPWVAITGG